jgi:hypothetical protein
MGIRIGTDEHDRGSRPAPNVARNVIANTHFGEGADLPCGVRDAEVE